ncbi:NADPH oxidase activator 1, partial [Silurus asotus]
MLYTELIQLWDEAVRAVDNQDWNGALAKLIQISDPSAGILFVTASVHLALVIAKDERLAVGFFQRAALHMMVGRLDEALGDCIWAQKHMRTNAVIDYKQLGLRYRLYTWQILYNAAAVHCRLNQWNKATEILQAASQEGGGRGSQVASAMQSVAKRELIAPLMVPEGVVFRPRKQHVEELQPRDFLGKAEVIISDIPNDDFGGFEPLRLQKPGYYEPQTEVGQDSRYMCVRKAYIGRNEAELTVPAGAYVYVYSEEDRDGFVTVIYDGQRGLLPNFLLETVTKKTKDKRKKESYATGIPLPPSMKPPTRPQSAAPPLPAVYHKQVNEETVLRSKVVIFIYMLYTVCTWGDHYFLYLLYMLLIYSVIIILFDQPGIYIFHNVHKCHIYVMSCMLPRTEEMSLRDSWCILNNILTPLMADSVIVKVHYTYTIALSVPLETPYRELQERIAQKLGQPAELIRLRHKQQGFSVLTPLDEDGDVKSLAEVVEAGRVTLWCQAEHSLANRTILYQMVALYDYTAQGPEDLEFSQGDTIDILSEVNEEWLEGHTAGNIGIFPRCFAYRD